MERSSLSLISSNRRRHSEYNAYQRGLIAGAQVCGVTLEAFQKRFGILKTFALCTLLNVLRNNNDDSASRSGRPRLLNIRDKQHILRISRHEPKISTRVEESFLQSSEGNVASEQILCLTPFGCC